MNITRFARVFPSITKQFFFLALSLIFILPADRADAATISGLFNTGVDEFGQALPAGSAEIHYDMVGPVSPAIVILPNPLWVAAPQGSAWIGPTNGNITDPLGNYTYSLTFDLTGFDHNSAVISGDYTGDNLTSIYLNGEYTGFGINDLRVLTPFEVVQGFVPGINRLDFVVNNSPGTGANPSGLLVANLRGTVVPVPAAIWLFLTAIVGLAGVCKRSKK